MQCHGFGETVAPLGTALTEDHIAILCKANRNITICFDGDAAGQKAAVRACGIVLPFLRDNSDVRFAFVTGGKDPDEVLKTGGIDAMKKIIDSSTGIIDFLWDTTNKNYIVSTPGGRSQAEKFLKTQIEKIVDAGFRREIENEYDTRKFNQWHKWKKSHDNSPKIKIPSVDEITKNTLIYIVNKFPDVVEQYGEFLSGLDIDFDVPVVNNLNFDKTAAEKYIVSLKLQRYIQQLNQEKKDILQMALSGDDGASLQIDEINNKIESAKQKLESLMDIQ